MEGCLRFAEFRTRGRAVGANRFGPPQPPPRWAGVLDAYEPGAAAPQPPAVMGWALGAREMRQSEDCLFLNVWAPKPAESARPVLVFLHGGGMVSGSGGLDWYDGAELARRGDIVVVTANFRLGALGYLFLADLDPDVGAGNFGLLDQAQALRWVKENIAAFGGDPDAVTVAGQSGGAISIIGLLSGSAATGLFRRAILQSAPAGMLPQRPAEATEIAVRFLNALDLSPAQASELRARSAADIMTAQVQLLRSRPSHFLDRTRLFQLVAADGLVAADSVGTVGTRAAGGVQVMIGTNRDEAAAMYVFDEQVHGLTRPGLEEAAARWLGNRSLVPSGDSRTPAELAIDLNTEHMYRSGSIRLAESLAAHGNPAWVYQFDWSPAGSPFGACHCLELPFVFGNLAAWADAPMLGGLAADVLSPLVDSVQGAWIAFTRNGNPTHDGIPDWPSYDGIGKAIMHFAHSTAVSYER
ncbi:carboxylesterase/lipase family protein [Fodinicola feengrottensis]|uniref:carboxylesterase/lipase family protein n=1 Tax=Fodinicola feengrottensis TaxID=435914 RepID=UPI0013D043BE|nr:carboxylesterase family protein [Fodinicola feengrottensis]